MKTDKKATANAVEDTDKDNSIFGRVSLPAKTEMAENILLSGRYKLCLYSGCRPKNLNDPPTGILLCIAGSKQNAPIIADGLASYFILSENEKPVFMGLVGTSGANLIVPNICFRKDSLFTVDSFSLQTLIVMLKEKDNKQ